MPSDCSCDLAIVLLKIIRPGNQTLTRTTADVVTLADALDKWRADHRWPAANIGGWLKP